MLTSDIPEPGWTEPANPASLASGNAREFTGPSSRALVASIVAQIFGGTAAIGLFPLLLVPVSTEFSWTRTELGAMAGVGALSAAIGMPLWGALIDARGVRLMLIIGLIATAAAFFLLAVQSGNIIQGVLSYALIGFCGALSVVHIKAQSARFNRRRGIVLAALGVAIGINFGVAPLIAKPVLDAYGWRAVYVVFGLFPLVLSLPLAIAWFHNVPIITRTGTGSMGITLRRALATRGFWIVVLFSGCSSFVFIGLQAHVVAFLQERGLSVQLAVEILSMAVAGTLVCQLGSGWLLDRFRSPLVAMLFLGAQLAGVAVLFVTSSTPGTIAGILLLNAGAGGELSMLPYLLSRIFGLGQLARIYGIAALFAQLLGSVSPVLLGVIHDRTGRYALAMPIFGAVLIIACVLVLLMPRFSEPSVLGAAET